MFGLIKHRDKNGIPYWNFRGEKIRRIEDYEYNGFLSDAESELLKEFKKRLEQEEIKLYCSELAFNNFCEQTLFTGKIALFTFLLNGCVNEKKSKRNFFKKIVIMPNGRNMTLI